MATKMPWQLANNTASVKTPLTGDEILAAWDQGGSSITARVDEVSKLALQSGNVTDVSVAEDAAIEASKLAFTATQAGAVPVSLSQTLQGALAPENFGAVGDGNADDTTALTNLFANPSKYGVLTSGKIYRVSATINIPSGFTLYSPGAGISTTDPNLIVLHAYDADDWSILGSLKLYGPGIGTSAANGAGLRVDAGQRFRVIGVEAQNFSGWGFLQGGGNYVAPRGNKGQWVACAAQNCWIGREDLPNSVNSNLPNEFNTWLGFNATGCQYGSRESAGNNMFIGGAIVDNVYGVVLVQGTNSTHGMSVGRHISHNSTYNVYADTQTAGYTFSGCHLYADDATHGLIYMGNCDGVKFVGCALESSVYNDQSSGYGYNFIIGCYNNKNFTLVKGGANPERVIWRDNITGDGWWSLNDYGYSFVKAYKSATQSITANSDTTILFDVVEVDARKNYTAATGTFVCPVAGPYEVSVAIRITGTSVSANGYLSLKRQGTVYAFAPIVPYSSTGGIANLKHTLTCQAGDAITISIVAQGSGLQITLGANELCVTLK